MGIWFGIMYFEFTNNHKFEELQTSIGNKYFKLMNYSKILRHTMFIVGLCLIVLAIWLPKTEIEAMFIKNWGDAVSAAYNSLCRPIFVLGLGFLMSGALSGKHSYVQSSLGADIWAPIARLTFITYLIHWSVYNFFYGNMRQANYLTHTNILWIFMAVLLISYVVSVPASLLIEAPILSLEKMFLFKPPQKERAPKSSLDESIRLFKLNEEEDEEEETGDTGSLIKHS